MKRVLESLGIELNRDILGVSTCTYIRGMTEKSLESQRNGPSGTYQDYFHFI